MTSATIPPAGWSYGGNPLYSDLDEVRLLIGDTDPSLPLLADAEIDYILSTWQPLYGVDDASGGDSAGNTMCAAVACNLIARKYAGITQVQVDGVSVDLSTISDRYRALAADLRKEYAERTDVGAEPEDDSIQAWFDCEYDPTVRALNFRMGQDDNPLAGDQQLNNAGAPWWGPDGWYS